MTEKRQRMISAMKYILLVIIVGYLVILMLYASGSKQIGRASCRERV